MKLKSVKRRLTAVLGPTNTGKTWYAIERMLTYQSGMIGLPLRLLAREVYERICAARGSATVALVTGEERIIPKQPNYWVCTVEAMPQLNQVDFLAVDEIQLCGDPERGHIFTNRLLSARGRRETVFLGSDTIGAAMRSLVPDISIKRRKRFSELTYTGSKKISRIKPHSAIVAFSIEDVYTIAEVVRQQRGGAAVVVGALSPRTRSAQVELYQNGDVEVLVATDAIGMGLNLDIDHVAFAGLVKFDGRRVRTLLPHEIGQIAGRAGRFRNNGTFGITADADSIKATVVNAVEEGKFQPLKRLQWRNNKLSFHTIDTLLETLQAPSENPLLCWGRNADDLIALRTMAEFPEIRNKVCKPSDVNLLWDVCQIPDFRKISPYDHGELLKTVFSFIQDLGQIPNDWLEEQINKVDRIDGDVEVLSRRIAFVRTWTYLSQRTKWIMDSHYWQERTRAVEDKISDALHAGLTRRFVDRRISVLMRQMKRKEDLLANVDSAGLLTIEGETVGRIEGFCFILDDTANADEAKILRQASQDALVKELLNRALRLYNAPDQELGLTDQGGFMWGQYAVGKLVFGGALYEPKIEIFVDNDAPPIVREQVERRLNVYIQQKISTHCADLLKLKSNEKFTGLVRGVAYQLYESFGIIPRKRIAEDVKALDQESRKLLRTSGIRFSQYAIFSFAALKPEATRIRLLLWCLSKGIDDFPSAPTPGLVTIPVNPSQSKEYYSVSGFYCVGNWAVRVDMLDRLSILLHEMKGQEEFTANDAMLSITGTSRKRFAELMVSLGYQVKQVAKEISASPVSDEGNIVTDNMVQAQVNVEHQLPVQDDQDVNTNLPHQEKTEKEIVYLFSRRPHFQPRISKANESKIVKASLEDQVKVSLPSNKKSKSNKRRKLANRMQQKSSKLQVDLNSPFAILADLKNRIDS